MLSIFNLKTFDGATQKFLNDKRKKESHVIMLIYHSSVLSCNFLWIHWTLTIIFHFRVFQYAGMNTILPDTQCPTTHTHTHTHTHTESILNFQISYQRWRFSDSHIQQLPLWINSHPAFPLHNLYFLSSSSHNFNHILDLAPCLVLYSSRERWMVRWKVVFIIDIQKCLRYNENVQMKTKEHFTLYYNHKAIIIYQH